MAYQIKQTDRYNSFTPEEQAKIQAAGKEAYDRYLKEAYASYGYNSPFNLEASAQEIGQRAAESQFTNIDQEKSQAQMSNEEQRARVFNSWYATQRGNKGIMEIPEQYKTALGGGDYVLKDGTLTQRSQIGQEEQYEAAVAAGTMRKVPVGQGFGYVPVGGPADLNLRGSFQQNIQAMTPEMQAMVQKSGLLNNQPVVAPQLGNTTLSLGSKDKNAVMELQKALNASGVGVNLKVDGVFGPATKAAVEAYQRANNLKVDGIVGQQTRGQLQGTPTPLSPADAAITEATTNNPLYNNLTPELKGLFDQLTMTISSLVEQGQRVNPDLEITPEMTARFLEQATKELDPYYQELIRQNKQDLSTSFQQLQQDYQTAVQREEPAFQKTLESQDIAEAEAGMAFSSGRQQREQDIISGQQQKLGDLFQTTQRGAEKLATTGERQIGSRAFADLGIPSLQQYAAQRKTISPKGVLVATGERSLYTPQTGLFGELPAQAKTAISTRASGLEEAERKKRLLDYSSKFGLGASSLG